MIDAAPNIDRLLLVVAAALVDDRDRILLARRPDGATHADAWEFPGGKVETGERPEHALVRELHEELGIVVTAEDLAPVAFASEPQGDRHLVLLLYRADRWTGEPMPLASRALAWVLPEDMASLTMPPADRPLVAAITRSIGREKVEARAGIEPACKDLQSSA